MLKVQFLGNLCKNRTYANSAKKMVVKHQIEGYPAFCEFIENLKDPKGNVHVLFSGSKLETGQSWCPTCVEGKYLF